MIKALFEGLATGTLVSKIEYKALRAAKARVKAREAEGIYAKLGDVVGGGPFKGMRLKSESAWSNDIISMLLGEYERELSDLFAPEHLKRHSVFIDVGSAIGYFAIGVACTSNVPVVAFEASPTSLKISAANAALNGLEPKIDFRGLATPGELSKLLEASPKALILIDIEGGELDLLNESVCLALAHATIILENHNVEKGSSARIVAARLAKSHSASFIAKTTRDPFAHPLLRHLSEDSAYLMLSEERGAEAFWLVLRPLKGQSRPDMRKALETT